MDVLIITASPNDDGLTAACGTAAAEGIQQAGENATIVCLNKLDIGRCVACGNGWGTCRDQHYCQEEDDFQALHEQMQQADAYVLVTPVYWGEMSEPAKAFTDRLRRCEATLQNASHLANKPVIAVAAAGGSGNGMITCLLSMERWIEHVRARKFDLIPVNRWSRDYKLAAIKTAAQTMAQEVPV